MDKRTLLLVTGVGLAAAAGGLAAGSAIWGGAAAPEQHADHEEAPGEHAEEEAAGEPGFVALFPETAPNAGIELTTVARGGGAELVLPGRVVFAPNAEAAVGAPLAGVVETVHVAIGSRVGAGTPLVTVRSAEGASMRAAADAARADAEAARAAFRREGRLFAERVTARQDWEASRAASLKAEAGLRAAQAQLAASGSPGTGGRATIRSPIAGTVTMLGTAPGGYVAQGASVAQVADTNRVELIFDAPAAVSRSIRVGTPIFASGAGGEEVRAIVTAVSPNPQEAGAQVRARPTGFVPPAGTPVSGRALTAGANALIVPTEAVQTLENRAVVFVVEANGFRARPVVPGRMAAGRTEILKGLAEGDRIAGRGAFLLKAELSKSEAEHEH